MHEAFDKTSASPLYSFTPITYVFTFPPFAGADITILFAPAFACFFAPSSSINTPVDSITTSIFNFAQGSFSGSRCARTRVSFPFAIIFPISGVSSVASFAPLIFSEVISPGNVL